MKSKLIGPLLLSGLIIGPILGSGIILLPPIIKEQAGNSAIIAWLIITILSFPFAYVFGKLSILFPGDSGVTNAVKHTFGDTIKQLTAVFMILAVCVGPVAVLMTASEYISLLFQWSTIKVEIYGVVLLIICQMILLRNISSLGKISLVLTSISALVLFIGGLSTLLFYRSEVSIVGSLNIQSLGNSVLLLFWAMMGWEIIGNYSMEVRDREKTIKKSVFFSAIIIAIIYITVAAAYQWIDTAALSSGQASSQLKLALIIAPLFGSYAIPVLTLITSALCVTTYIMIVGGIARLISAQAEDSKLPKVLGYKSKSNIPIVSLILLASIHLIVLVILYTDLVNLELLVEIANAFFISNAIIGLLAAMRIIKNWAITFSCMVLIVALFWMLTYSPIWVLLLIGILTLYAILAEMKKRSTRVKLVQMKEEV
ncbi:amino acid permease [Bacillus sp. SM2101]|uniref:APC family permease n=1 Tax=Bacillus sp. SM2101 TaxID=2805366 RepID=UPI001BDE6782|nr:amino acid permease [Bacillus sp. SM2101]